MQTDRAARSICTARLCGQTGPDARGADGGLVGATAAWPRGGELID